MVLTAIQCDIYCLYDELSAPIGCNGGGMWLLSDLTPSAFFIAFLFVLDSFGLRINFQSRIIADVVVEIPDVRTYDVDTVRVEQQFSIIGMFR